MVGFNNNSGRETERRSTGIYSPLVGSYVRVFLHGNNLMGKLNYVDHVHLELLPHLVGQGTMLEEKIIIVDDLSAIIEIRSVQGIHPLPDGRAYFDRIIKDAEEKTKTDQFLKTKELESKGYKPA